MPSAGGNASSNIRVVLTVNGRPVPVETRVPSPQLAKERIRQPDTADRIAPRVDDDAVRIIRSVNSAVSISGRESDVMNADTDASRRHDGNMILIEKFRGCRSPIKRRLVGIRIVGIVGITLLLDPFGKIV